MEVCRICGGTENLKCFQGNEQLAELLRVCANITVTKGDILPKHICEQCEFGLRFSYKLRKQSEETEKRLRHEMQTQSISTPTDVQDALSNDGDGMIMSAIVRPVFVHNVCSNNEFGKETHFVNEESLPDGLETNEQQVNTSPNEINKKIQVLDGDMSQEVPVAERLRLELRKRGVIMCARAAADESEVVNSIENTQQVIAGKRVRLELNSNVDGYAKEVNSYELENKNCNNSLKEVIDCNDVIELLDDESMMVESLNDKNIHESEMNTNIYEAQNIIEEIFSLDENFEDRELEGNANIESTLTDNQTDIVYEHFDDDLDESIGIDECQIYFTKEEQNNDDLDCEEYGKSINALENDDPLDADESQENNVLHGEDKTINNMEDVSTHTMLNEKILTYTCATCNLECDTHRELREHIKTHGDKRFLCKECNKWFPQLSRLQRHAKCHQINDDRLQCPQCERTYQLRANLTRHIRNVHEKKGCICVVCGEKFGRSDVLKNHMAKHTDERDFQCDKCPLRFKSNHYLKKHLRMHQKCENEEASNDDFDGSISTTKKTHYCHYCGKVSKHHFTHKMHMRIHTQERPHKCEACSKAFRTLAALITHERIHDDARPYQCEHCLLSFRQQGHLKEHRMIHEGITPHVCSICKLAFTKKNNMLVHMRIHSGENPYKCIACGEQFKKLAQLRKHEFLVHKKPIDGEDNDIELLDHEENDDEGFDYEEEHGKEQPNDEFKNESRFADLASELLDSESNSLQVIEKTNVHPIGNNIMSDVIDIQGSITEEITEEVPSVGCEPTFSDHFNVDDIGVVLVVDDNAKFNSLFIMDE